MRFQSVGSRRGIDHLRAGLRRAERRTDLGKRFEAVLAVVWLTGLMGQANGPPQAGLRRPNIAFPMA